MVRPEFVKLYSELPYMKAYESYLRQVRGNNFTTIQLKLFHVYAFVDWLLLRRGYCAREDSLHIEGEYWQWLQGKGGKYVPEAGSTIIGMLLRCSRQDFLDYYRYLVELVFAECQHERVAWKTVATYRGSLKHFYEMLVSNRVIEVFPDIPWSNFPR